MSRQLTTLLLLLLVVALLLPPADSFGGGGGSSKRKKKGKRRHNRKKKKKRHVRRKKKENKNSHSSLSSSTSSSSSGFNHGRINRNYDHLTAYELLERLTDEAGPNKGFSILLQLIEAAELQDEIDGLLQDYTLFAPNDQAFCRTARNDLEYEGSCDPPDAEAVLEYYVALLILLAGLDEAALGEILVAILTYHAADGRMTVHDLRRKGHFATYCQCFEIEVKKQTKKITKLIDAGRKYPNIEFRQQNIAVKDDGIVHIVKSVLLPPLEDMIDPDPPTPGECPEGGGDDCFFAPFNPHICGDDYACYYSTLCDVEVSGFDRDDDCCQQAGEDVVCTDEFNPVTCGSKDCPYDNLCLAIGSGYDENQCTGGSNGGRCRGPAPGTVCSKKLEPVECGTRNYSCPYNNLCLANSAGWTESQCTGRDRDP